MIRQVAYLAMHTSPLSQPGVGNAGGMNVYVHELATTMAGRGIGGVVFTRRTDPHLPEVIEPAPGYRVVHVDAGPAATLPIEDLGLYVAPFAEAVVEWANANREDFDLIHSHYWLSGWAGVLVKDALGLPLANSFHTLGRAKGGAHAPSMRVRTEEEVIALADCVVAATPYEFDDLLEHYGASPQRLRVSPPGVDRGLFSPGDRAESRRSLGLGDEPLALFVGRIQPHKGIDIAIRMLAGMPLDVGSAPGPPQLIIVGGPSGPDGPEEVEHLRRLTADLGLTDRVRFFPPQPHAALADFYRAADVLVMPSRTESFGLVAVEAQACGLPVVASRVGGLAYTVADSESGLLVDGHEPGSFTAAVTAVLDHPQFRTALAAGAEEFAVRFSWPAAADRFLDLYQELTRDK